MDRELEGKVIMCLKIKFRESKLSMKCEQQMTNVLREAALNYHLNPLLATLCANEVSNQFHKNYKNIFSKVVIVSKRNIIIFEIKADLNFNFNVM